MSFQRKYLFYLLLKLCFFIVFVALIYLYVQNGVHKQTFSYKMTGDGTERPVKQISSEKDYPSPVTVRFSLPVDLVITWVNGSDPLLIEDMKRFNVASNRNTSPNRFRDWGILRYCLRSVEKYANWFRHIYIVTNGQVPRWLNTKYPRVSVVKHSDIFPNKSHVPTFNSAAIESNIHRIPGLSQQFVYMNDDFFFASPVEPEDFYTEETGLKIRFSGAEVPNCSVKCKLSDINNGICDTSCNTSRCDWDGVDCNTYSRLSGLQMYSSFFGALMYTVFLYNKEFGYVHRKVPEHVPHAIDISIMNELQNRFPEEWQRTSASRIRDSYNFQYAFAYYHYLLRPQRCTRLEENSRPIATTYHNYEDYIYFTTGNSERLKERLDRLLQYKDRKFACINDIMSYWNSAEEARCQTVIDKFFNQLFPNSSAFEFNEIN